MIFWYDSLYMDDAVRRKEKKCRKIIEKEAKSTAAWYKLLFKKSYFIVALAHNGENLFEIMNTNQMFFRYYGGTGLYILGVAKDYDGAVEIFRYIVTKGYGSDHSFDPRKMFTKDKFVCAGKQII